MKVKLTIQGFFNLLAGLWPLISITTFMMVTAPQKRHLAGEDNRDLSKPYLLDAGMAILMATFYIIQFPWGKI